MGLPRLELNLTVIGMRMLENGQYVVDLIHKVNTEEYVNGVGGRTSEPVYLTFTKKEIEHLKLGDEVVFYQK